MVPLALALPVTVTVSDTGSTCRLLVVVLLLVELLLVLEELLLVAPPPPPQLKLDATTSNDSKPAG
jgi:hypothetical protein